MGDDHSKLTEKVERALFAMPVHIAAKRLKMTREEMRDHCPEFFEDDDTPEGNPISGY